MAFQIISTAQYIPVDTRANAGTIILPLANAVSGRTITFKDMYGTFFTNPLFLSSQAGNLFDDNTNLKAMRNPYGFVTLACNGVSTWNTIDGTLFPVYTISTITAPLRVSVTSLSTANATLFFSTFGTAVSSIALQDQVTLVPKTLFTRSTVLYYGGLAVAGAKAGAGQFLSIK